MNKNELPADSTSENREYILEVTEEEYQERLKMGWTDDDMLPPGEHKFRRVSSERAAKFRDSRPHQFYLEVKLRLDEDVFKFFTARAEELSVDLYQTLINDELRRAMEKQKAIELSPAAQELLNDENFLSALKEKLKEKPREDEDLREAA